MNRTHVGETEFFNNNIGNKDFPGNDHLASGSCYRELKNNIQIKQNAKATKKSVGKFSNILCSDHIDNVPLDKHPLPVFPWLFHFY